MQNLINNIKIITLPSNTTDPVTAVGVSNPEILSVRNIPIIDLREH